MPLRNFAQTLLLLGMGVVQAGVALGDFPTAIPDRPSVRAAPPRTPKAAMPVKPLPNQPTQDQLISEILGLTPTLSNAKSESSGSGSAVFTCVAMERQADDGEAPAPSRQQRGGALNGTIIGVNLKTSTVDVEFSGLRRPTVGSQFSVHHDYALSSEHLGRLEIVYLAGSNRAIARPAGRTDLARLGKRDRISGRIVSSSGSSGNAMQMATHKSATKTRSCVTPPAGEMPNPPAEPEAPYVPEEPPAPEGSTPSPLETTQAGGKLKTLMANWALPWTDRTTEPKTAVAVTEPWPLEAPAQPTKAKEGTRPRPLPIGSAVRFETTPQPKWTALTARSWKSLLKPASTAPETAALKPQVARSAVPAKPSAKSLWCAIKPKPAKSGNPSPKSVVLASAKEPPPAIVLFEESTSLLFEE